MSDDPKIDKKLRQKLSSYKVDVPEFPMQRNWWDRLINFLASPAKNPLDRFTQSFRGIATMNILPVFGALVLSIIQIFFMIK